MRSWKDVSIANGRPTSPRKLFLERLERAGLIVEYRKAWRRARLAKINPWFTVRELFGYLGPEGEREADAIYMDSLRKEDKIIAQRLSVKRMSNVVSPCKYQTAYASLPLRADYAQEMNWVRVHPKILEQARLAPNDPARGKNVTITVHDILSPKNNAGPAPSQWAVNQLQYWVHRPDEFFRLMMASDERRFNNAMKQRNSGGPPNPDKKDPVAAALAEEGDGYVPTGEAVKDLEEYSQQLDE